MSIFHGNEFLISLPEVLKDKTVNVFALSDDGPSDFSVVISRERPQAGETLERFTERVTAALISRLPLFHVEKREVIRVDGQPAILLDYTWQSKEGKTFQRLVTVPAKAQGVMLLLTATTREKLGARWEALFEEFLAGFRLRAS